MTIKIKYEFGDTVYIKNDPEQRSYIFVGVVSRPGSISYELSYLGEVSELYDFEVSKERDEFKVLGLEDKTEQQDGG